MRGFVHILEIMIMGLVLFMLLSQFSLPSFASNWERARLKLLGWDVLFTLDSSGINWLNSSEVEQELERLLPENVVYNLTIFAPPPEIHICGDLADEIEGIVEVNGVKINLTTAGKCQVNISRRDFSTIPTILVKDFSSSDNLPGFLEWAGKSQGNATWNISPTDPEWLIYLWFHAIENETGQTWPEPWNFSFKSNVSGDKAILAFRDGQAGLVISGSRVWIPENGCKGKRELLASLILWLAPDSFSLGEPVLVKPVRLVYLTAVDREFFQPLRIELRLGYRY